MSNARSLSSPRALARFAGGLYLLIMVAAMFAEGGVRERLIVSGDGAETLHNIMVSQSLWRWGVLADVATTLSDVAVSVLLFILLRPAGGGLSLSAAAFRLVYSAIMAGSAALLMSPLALIQHPVAGPEASALTAFALGLHQQTFSIALIVFGVHLVLVGALIVRSTFLPRVIGWALGLAGLCYMINSTLGVVSPTVAQAIFPWILLPGFLAEGALTLWMLIFGVNEAAWRAASGPWTPLTDPDRRP